MTRIVAEYDVGKSYRNNDQVRRAFTPDVLGEYYGKMRRGTSSFLSNHQDDIGFENTNGLSSWRLSRGIVDIVVVGLESTELQQDYMEFHFTHGLERGNKEELEASLTILVRAWAGRKTGFVTQAQMDDRMVAARAAAKADKLKSDAPMLGTSNPASLSRAEFRVCLLLSRGLSIKGVTDELSLSEATARGHLRIIYSRTEVSGLLELLYRLLSSQSEAQRGVADRM